MAKETYTIERVDNGWTAKYTTSKGVERVEVYEDGDFFDDREMQIKESLHIVLYNVFQDYMADDDGGGGLTVDLVESAPEEEGSENETQESGDGCCDPATKKCQ